MSILIGVPDSALKDWWARQEEEEAIITADEGEAVALAAGYFLGTGDTATVFMGSDGLCNALNPLTSLILPYMIPINLVIGVRTDCPQHKIMGDKVVEIVNLIDKDKFCHVTYITKKCN